MWPSQNISTLNFCPKGINPPWFFFEIRQVLESWVSRLKLKVLKIYLVQWLVEHEERICSKEFQQLVAHTLVEIFWLVQKRKRNGIFSDLLLWERNIQVIESKILKIWDWRQSICKSLQDWFILSSNKVKIWQKIVSQILSLSN